MWQNIYVQTSNAPLSLKSSLKVALILFSTTNNKSMKNVVKDTLEFIAKKWLAKIY